MMDPLEFLELADEWAVGTREGEWRSSASRAYYAAFHIARDTLSQAGFQVPQGAQCHAYLYFRLNNCGEAAVQAASRKLSDLRELRNRADYDLKKPFAEKDAIEAVNWAIDVTQTLAALAVNSSVLAQVTQVIIAYETTAYGSTTWQAP